MALRQDADIIIAEAIAGALPDSAVRRALEGQQWGSGKLVLVAVGKGGWQMAHAAWTLLGERISGGVVVTKYDHARGAIGNLTIVEAGHPVPDENSFAGTRAALAAVSGLTGDDTVIFLVSGGGSALFEQPLVPAEELFDITRQLLACGADIVEINTVRKRLSAVKGGKFAIACAPARVYAVVLSDIIGDPLDMIASGPAYPDSSTSEQAVAIVNKYSLKFSPEALALLRQETPKELTNVDTVVTGSVRQLCETASATATRLGYRPVVLTACLDCEAREAGRFVAAMARHHADTAEPLAFIVGGETVVHLTGKGLGGRNQEFALAAAPAIAGMAGTAIFSVGSDGTDGPTDAAGGYVDGSTAATLSSLGIDIGAVLRDNDSYHALERCGGLVKTGATGTNVNDFAVLLIGH